MNLFADMFTESDTTGEQVVAPIHRSKPETIGEVFARLLANYRMQLVLWSQALSALASEEEKVTKAESYMLAFKPMNDAEVTNSVRERSQEIRQRLVWLAEKEFSYPGQKLSIPNDFPEEFEIDRDSSKDFDPAAFWAYLENTYGGEKGREIAFEQGANAVVNAFSISKSAKVEMKAGYVILSRSVSIDSFDKKWGKTRLHHSSRQSLATCANSLAQYAIWANRTLLGIDLRKFAEHIWRSNDSLVSREQIVCGDKEIIIVAFQSRYEFRIQSDLAKQLQIFIGTYAQAALRD